VSKEHSEDCKKLLRLMGVPVIDAPCEAEAQCAELVRSGKAHATATEDMDALTFGSTILVRNMTASEAKKLPIKVILMMNNVLLLLCIWLKVKEFSLEKILSELEMTFEQFIDLCILLGCDYCPSIKGIGPKKAYELMVQHKSIENILENLDHKVPLFFEYCPLPFLFFVIEVPSS
jgi:flap endonuclease-1